MHRRDSRVERDWPITDRNGSEATSTEFAAHLLRAQESERASIARELHDDIGQSLALLSIKLKKLELDKRGSPDERVLVEDLCRLSDKITLDVQRLSHGLHPASLEFLGLTNAMRQQCAEFAENSDSKVEYHLGEMPRTLEKEIAVCLFRVLQESLRNIVKHSSAEKVTIDLSAELDRLRLQVRDDGVGFDTAADNSRSGLGLTSMRERLRMIGGKLTVTSAPGQGTQIEAFAPLLEKAHILE